jgi:hypothetical protein
LLQEKFQVTSPALLQVAIPARNLAQTRREFPASFSNALLREAIKNNSVSFPSQTPCFANNSVGGLHWRIAQLYFVSGWSIGRICVRHHLSKQMVRNILSQWRLRAVAAGFVQEIQPEHTKPAEPRP